MKTLEEPPEYAIFILATTEKHKILPTIISRCQVYDFNRIQINDTVDYLKYVAQNEKIDVETEALEVMAQKADGAMRDALSIFDQIVSYCGNKITYKEVIDILNVLDYEYYLQMVDCFVRGDVVGSLMILDKIINKGFDVQSFVSGFIESLQRFTRGSERTQYKPVTSERLDKKTIRRAGKNMPSRLFVQSLGAFRTMRTKLQNEQKQTIVGGVDVDKNMPNNICSRKKKQ